jgi:hypothetical protein
MRDGREYREEAGRARSRPVRSMLMAAALMTCSILLMAQSSASYKIESGVFNAGGNPSPVLMSTNFKVTLDAIGDSVAATGMSSASYNSGAGFVPDYPPPREVQGDKFTNKTTLTWLPDPSVGSYDVYEGTVPSFTPTFGSCLASGLTTEQCTISDVPSSGQCFYYLITAKNTLAEEGTKGYQTSGTERGNPSPCP